MELSPRLYHWIIRPKWISNLYIGNVVSSEFDLDYKKVLDFGCGIGSICHMLKSSNYLGIDCDNKRIDYARRLNPGYNFDILQEKQIPAADNSVDYVLTISVLHHIPSEQLKDYIEEFQRVLKPDGKIIAIEPCFFNNHNFNN